MDVPVTGQAGTFGLALLWGGFGASAGRPPAALHPANHVRAVISSAGRLAPVRLLGEGSTSLQTGRAGAELRFVAESEEAPAGIVLLSTLGDEDALVLEEGGQRIVIRPAQLIAQLGSTEALSDGRTLSMVAFAYGAQTDCTAGVAIGSWTLDAHTARHSSAGVVIDAQGALLGRFVGQSEEVSDVTWFWSPLTEQEGRGALSVSVFGERIQGSLQPAGMAPGPLFGLVSDAVSPSGLLIASFQDACEVSE